MIEDRLVELFQFYPVVAVLGARQVGKSTLVENLFSGQVSTTVFDPVVDIGNVRQDPDFFLQNVTPPAFFDEVQYAPELLNSIKRKVDQEKKNGMFILSGSQNLSVLKDISESLAGRVAILNLLPMSHSEVNEKSGGGFLEQWLLAPGQKDFSETDIGSPVFDAIWKGGYPKISELPDSLIPGYWQSYMQTYIERDVRKVANIGSLQTFGRFIGLLGALTSQEINHNQLGRELGITRNTARSWTETAESTFQWISIPAFSRNPVKRISGKNKGYFTDTGLICNLQKISSPKVIASHPIQGALFETFVVMEIVKLIQKLPIQPNLYHFRSHSGAEVDLILELDGRLYPVEIKSKSNPTRKDIRGFQAFRDCFPKENIQKGLVICAVPSSQHIREDILAVPWWSL
ncbi:ATP-binding protein [uncultured Desulfosarcina sp.]|uniref:ATP-binding protein n=1 Tax=uncultured Desulfosarcina sp. TaxID=218289 RepID=UPI0029C64480|nr:ATP-binding protein [uncultured Desulfosarcina sp.]